MNIFDCAGCKAKDGTILILREQLGASQHREETLQKANLALVDARAAAITYRRPRPESGPREVPNKGEGPTTWDGIRGFTVPDASVIPLTKESIEEAFRQPAGVNPAGFSPQRSA